MRMMSYPEIANKFWLEFPSGSWLYSQFTTVFDAVNITVVRDALFEKYFAFDLRKVPDFSKYFYHTFRSFC